MPTYLVVSYEYPNGSADVKLHCLTVDLREALRCYVVVLRTPSRLVQLVEVTEQFSMEQGFTFFWGKETPNVRILESNNK